MDKIIPCTQFNVGISISTGTFWSGVGKQSLWVKNYKRYYCFKFEKEVDPSRPKIDYSNSRFWGWVRGDDRNLHNEMYDMSVENVVTEKHARKVQLPTM